MRQVCTMLAHECRDDGEPEWVDAETGKPTRNHLVKMRRRLRAVARKTGIQMLFGDRRLWTTMDALRAAHMTNDPHTLIERMDEAERQITLLRSQLSSQRKKTVAVTAIVQELSSRVLR